MTTFVAVISSVIVYFLADNAQKHGGLAAWRVINLFLGGLTIFLGILDVIVWDTPDRAWWLKPEEKKIAQARVVSNASESNLWVT
jgi:hypothetical protein